MSTIDELSKQSRLPPQVLSEIERQFERMKQERRASEGVVGMGSFGEDEPFLHFLHASHEEQLRVARDVLGMDVQGMDVHGKDSEDLP